MKTSVKHRKFMPVYAKGHRHRLKARLLKESGIAIEIHHLLEILLFYAIPVRDTRRESVELFRRFGDVKRIMCASPRMLLQIRGIGRVTADLWQCVSAFLTETNENTVFDSKIVDIPIDNLPCYDSIPSLLTNLLGNDAEGTYGIALLDVQMNLLSLKKQIIGNHNHYDNSEDLRHILEVLSSYREGSSAVFVHRHYQSVLTVDEADCRAAELLSRYLKDIHICMQFMYICNHDEYLAIGTSGTGTT